MEVLKMSDEQQAQKIPFKHYVYLVLWGGSMFLACTPGFGWIWGLLFLTLFFLVTTFKVMKKLLLVFLLTFIFSVHQATGNVFDAEGKLLGKITDDDQGAKIFLDKNGNVIRKFNFDGVIFNGNNIEIGCATV